MHNKMVHFDDVHDKFSIAMFDRKLVTLVSNFFIIRNQEIKKHFANREHTTNINISME